MQSAKINFCVTNLIKEDSMNSDSDSERPIPSPPKDRIEGSLIILDSHGEFPKRVIILEDGKKREYSIRKTQKGGYLMN